MFLAHYDLLLLVERQCERKGAALAWLAHHLDGSAMCLDGIFYHGKTYAISALMVCGWYAIELLEYLLLIFLVDAYAMVRHADDGEMLILFDVDFNICLRV